MRSEVRRAFSERLPCPSTAAPTGTAARPSTPNRAFVAGRPGWEKTLADYPGTTDVVVQSDAAIAQLLETEGWSVACQDGSYTWLTAPGVTGDCPSTGAH